MAARLIKRARRAVDGRRYELAATLYEEALIFTPARPRIHIQCGHMLKEAGELDRAEFHYDEARRLLPRDADLALQLGHFYKVAMRPDEARAAYRKALELRPGWIEAAEELDRLQQTVDDLGGTSAVASTDMAWIVPELLPRPRNAAVHRRGMQVRRLAPRRMRTEWGLSKALQGVEAVRGFYIGPAPAAELQILLDGTEITRSSMQSIRTDGATFQYKSVFNVWFDFSAIPPGRYQIELRPLGVRGRAESHFDDVVIVAPDITVFPDSDAQFVPQRGDDQSIIEQINSRPSVIRPAVRTDLPARVRSILVQRVDQLGDLVCSVPAIRRLRELFPGAKLVGLLSEANASFGRTLNLFDEIEIAEFAEDPIEGRRTMPIEAQDRLRLKLASYRFDIAVDLCEVSSSRPLLLLSNAKFLYGFKAREWQRLSAEFELNAHDPINALETTSQSRKILALVESLGALRQLPPHFLAREDLRRERLAALNIGPRDRFVLLHTGARLAYSRWPGFFALSALLLERTELKVVMLRDASDEQDSVEQNDRLRVLTGRLPFDDLDALLSFCSAFVGNDSGVKHLAALRGAPVVSLHMARLNWNEWGQENSGLIISRQVPCAGCAIHLNQEECGQNFACIRRIEPEEVLKAVLALLN